MNKPAVQFKCRVIIQRLENKILTRTQDNHITFLRYLADQFTIQTKNAVLIQTRDYHDTDIACRIVLQSRCLSTH